MKIKTLKKQIHGSALWKETKRGQCVYTWRNLDVFPDNGLNNPETFNELYSAFRCGFTAKPKMKGARKVYLKEFAFYHATSHSNP
jgi:hypothetical protein